MSKFKKNIYDFNDLQSAAHRPAGAWNSKAGDYLTLLVEINITCVGLIKNLVVLFGNKSKITLEN